MLVLKIFALMSLGLFMFALMWASFRLCFWLAEKLIEPVLRVSWSWCHRRGIPFPNLWEGIGGVVVPLSLAVLTTLSVWISVSIQSRAVISQVVQYLLK